MEKKSNFDLDSGTKKKVIECLVLLLLFAKDWPMLYLTAILSLLIHSIYQVGGHLENLLVLLANYILDSLTIGCFFVPILVYSKRFFTVIFLMILPVTGPLQQTAYQICSLQCNENKQTFFPSSKEKSV